MTTIAYLSGPPYPGGQIDNDLPLQFVYTAGDAAVVVVIPQDAIFAMVAYPYDETVEVAVSGPPFPGGVLDTEDPLEWIYFGATTPVYAATEGFRTKPADSPASEYFPGTMVEPANTRVTLFGGAEPAGDAQRNEGELRIIDPGGDADAWKDYGWDGRKVEIWRGQRKAFRDYRNDPATYPKPWTTFTKVTTVTTEGLKYDLKEKRIMLRAMTERLYRHPLLERTYDGSGGIHGDAGAKGRFAPQIYGDVFNYPPVQFDSANLVHALHDRKMQAVVEVRDGGSPLIATTDYPTYEALIAASIGTGFYGTCLEAGMLRLGVKPQFGIRCDAKGDAAMFNGFGYVDTRAGIVRRLATTRGAAYLDFDTEIDHYTFQRLDGEQSGPVGFAFFADTTVGEAIDQMMMGCAGYWGMTPDAQMFVGSLYTPDGEPEHVFTYPDDFYDEPEMQTYVLPRHATRIGWRRNYGPQAPSDLSDAVGVTAALQQLYGEEWSFAEQHSPTIETKYPGARKVAVPAGYAVEGNAVAEAIRQQQIFGVRRERWRMPVRYNPFSKILGRLVAIRNFNRYGFGSLKLMICVGVSERASSNRVELDLWG